MINGTAGDASKRVSQVKIWKLNLAVMKGTTEVLPYLIFIINSIIIYILYYNA